VDPHLSSRTGWAEARPSSGACPDFIMKEQDHSVVTHWGGRKERYREFPRTQIRAHDPFAVQPLLFPAEYQYEAWVLERFSPTTKAITCRPTQVTAIAGGASQIAKATFVITRRDEKVDYVITTANGKETTVMRRLRSIAESNGASVIVVTRQEIRQRVDEFWWWEKLRQVATLWARRGIEYDEALVALVTTEERTLADLCALIETPRDLIRARLARLHVAGRLVIRRQDGALRACKVAGGLQ
jgi:predicted CoA-binding protein